MNELMNLLVWPWAVGTLIIGAVIIVKGLI